MNKLIIYSLIIIIIIIIIVVVIFYYKKINFSVIKEYVELEPIPKVIHKVYLQNSGKMEKFPLELRELQEAHDSWKRMNPEYEIKYYSMDDCREYLKKHFEDSDFLQAFDCLNAYSFKCDFFRYCVLYNEGGWYSDWKQVCLVNNLLNELNEKKQNNIVYFNDLGQKPILKYISIGFIGSIKNKVEIKEAINKIINNIKYKNYDIDSLSVTGPGLLKCFLNTKNSIGDFMLIDDEAYNKFNNKIIIKHKCNNCGKNQDWNNGNNYNELWKNKQIYKDFKLKDVIPKIIHKTGPQSLENLSIEIDNLFKKTIENNPDYKIQYYDDIDCYEIIKNNFEPDVLYAYNMLKPTAYKADLFRYCILYLYGGIYSDLTQNFLVPLNNIIDFNKDTLILTEDRYIKEVKNKCIQISFICSIPKNIIFKKAIDKVVLNVKNNYYGYSMFDITGPCLFKNVLNNVNINYILKSKQVDNDTIIDYNNSIKIINMYSKNHHKMLYNKNNLRYGPLWASRNIYNKPMLVLNNNNIKVSIK